MSQRDRRRRAPRPLRQVPGRPQQRGVGPFLQRRLRRRDEDVVGVLLRTVVFAIVGRKRGHPFNESKTKQNNRARGGGGGDDTN